MLAQCRICVHGAWPTWNELPERQQSNVEQPRFGMLPPGSDFFKKR
jgi:hypothetical protein